MYVILVTIQIKPENRDQFIEASMGDCRGSVQNEPGCLRFDVIQDESDPNRIHFYEVYRDKAAFEQHLQMPHYHKWRDAVKDWFAKPNVVGKGTNMFPPDDWQQAWGPERS